MRQRNQTTAGPSSKAIRHTLCQRDDVMIANGGNGGDHARPEVTPNRTDRDRAISSALEGAIHRRVNRPEGPRFKVPVYQCLAMVNEVNAVHEIEELLEYEIGDRNAALVTHVQQ